jgi:hypothetical protein
LSRARNPKSSLPRNGGRTFVASTDRRFLRIFLTPSDRLPERRAMQNSYFLGRNIPHRDSRF